MGSRILQAMVAAVVVVASALAYVLAKSNSDDPYVHAVYTMDRGFRDLRADLRRKPAEVLRFAGVTEGMTVVDLFGGTGYYAELMSLLVGDSGQVVLQNNSLFLRFSQEGLEHRLRAGRLENVVRLDSEFADLQLPENVDLIFMGLSYHDIYVPRDDPTIMTSREEFFPQIHRALKPGGKILVIDHAAEMGSGASAAAWHHRIAEDYAIDDFENAGFTYVGSLDLLRNNNDDYSLRIWDEKVEGKTDKFIHLYTKP